MELNLRLSLCQAQALRQVAIDRLGELKEEEEILFLSWKKQFNETAFLSRKNEIYEERLLLQVEGLLCYAIDEYNHRLSQSTNKHESSNN